MSNQDIKRWTKISLRTLHLLSVAGVGGGILFGIEKGLWFGYWWLAIVSGVLLMLIDIFSNRIWLVQIRGITVFLKLLLLVLMVKIPAWDVAILMLVIIMSSIISHAPGKLRYYSIAHRKVIICSADTKG